MAQETAARTGQRDERSASDVRDLGTLSGLDRITLRGIEGFGRHGVYPAERQAGQRFVVDVVCAVDLSRAAATDALDQTVDYGELASAIRADVEGEPVNLVEALAGRIADTCLARQRIRTVEVTVHKPEAPMAVAVADVAVTLIRSSSA